MQSKTIIIGGGMAGMSCALKLLEAGQDFLLITDRLGGRIMYNPESKVNFGAYFVMDSYTQARKLLTRQDLLKPTDVCFHNSESERFAVLSGHTVSLLPEFIRFYLAMRTFSAHYEPYKKRCQTMTQKAALETDPYMADIFAISASQFIRQNKFERAASDYISKFTYACTGVGTDQLTALDFLNVSMGMIVPIHRFSFDAQAMADKLGDHLVLDTIERLEQQDGRVNLLGKSGQSYQAQKVVVATPAVVTQQLLALKEIRAACQLYVFHVKAELKPIYSHYEMNLFPNTSEIILTARQFDGTYLIYARESAVDLHKVCTHFTTLATMAWDKAMYVQGSAYVEQKIGENIYVAGDHNGLGLEPAALSGIYAANQIINQTASVKN